MLNNRYVSPAALLLVLAIPMALVAQQPSKPKPSAISQVKGQEATIIRTNGSSVYGRISSATNSNVTINTRGLVVRIAPKDIQSIRTNNDLLQYDPATKSFISERERAEQARQDQIAAEAKTIADEAARSGKVKVINATTKTFKFLLLGYKDKRGNEYFDPAMKTQSKLDKFLSGERPGLKNWTLKPSEEVYAIVRGETLSTSKIWFTIETAEGPQSWSTSKTDPGPDFILKITDESLHTTVLAKIGRWNLEQNISFTTRRARTPTKIEPVKGILSGKIKYYEVTGGEEYEYEQENREGVATAWAEIENPTDRTLDVEATLEFDFTDILQSHQTVCATITVAPKKKTKMYVTVNTAALFGNRKATAVHQINIVTKPK